MKYGINNVVGGFGRQVSAEEVIPFVVARTHKEHKTLRWILSEYPMRRRAIELGCGYGRNLGVLEEFSEEVYGMERDQELSRITLELYPAAFIGNIGVDNYDLLQSNKFDLILTFTFLQHLSAEELDKALTTIERVSTSNCILILCEETDPAKTEPGVECWPVEVYKKILPKFELVETHPRQVEATFPGADSGTFMVFEKRG